jgi:hypothetical protein
MVRFVRTASILPGKLMDALAFAREVSEHIQKQYGVKVEVLMPVGGNPQRIAWKADYASLGALEDMQSKFLADQKYLEITAKGSLSFIAGSINDAIWRTV